MISKITCSAEKYVVEHSNFKILLTIDYINLTYDVLPLDKGKINLDSFYFLKQRRGSYTFKIATMIVDAAKFAEEKLQNFTLENDLVKQKEPHTQH